MSKELVQLPDSNGNAVTLRHAFTVPDENDQPMNMSFDPTTLAGAEKLIMATFKEVPLLETLAKEYLHITDYLTHHASSTDDKTGEVQPFIRIVVWDVTGQAFSCGSIGVAKSLSFQSIARGAAPWNPPAKVKVVSRRLGNGKNWLILEPDMADLAAAMELRRKTLAAGTQAE